MKDAFGHRWLRRAALTGLTLAACQHAVTGSQAGAAPFFRHSTKPVFPKVPTRLIVLPDSAIAVAKGSTEEELADFLASPAPAPRTFRFVGTEFASWAAKPNEPTLRTMYAMTQILHAYPKARVLLVGYTDNDGTTQQNLVLARQRVDRLAEILIHGGVRRDRIETDGRGAVDFIGDNATPEGRARNRRIELTITAK